jgi:Flp pilus assembly pilin Flp
MGFTLGNSMFQRQRSGIRSLLRRLRNDEGGGEITEYALILGLIVVVAIAVISSVGTKVLARWQSVNSSM